MINLHKRRNICAGLLLVGALILSALSACGRSGTEDTPGFADIPEDQDSVNKVQVLVVKNRHGETGTVEFAWDGEHTLFLPLEKNYDDR